MPNEADTPKENYSVKQEAAGGVNLCPCSSSDQALKHEVMDRASVLMGILDTTLGNHPGMNNGNLKEIQERAQIALNDLYQEAARIAFNIGADETGTTETIL